MQRAAVDVIGRSHFHDVPEIHHGNAIRDVPDDREIVRDEDVGQAEFLLQILHQVDHLRLNRHIERAHRFVGDDDLRIGRQRARDADALPLPAGELVRIAVRVIRRQADLLEQPAHAVARARPLTMLRVNPQRLLDDPPDRLSRIERRVRILEHHLKVGPVRSHAAIG